MTTITINATVPGAVIINELDTAAITGPILNRLDALEANVTAPLNTFDDALAALQAQVAALQTEETAERAAFDALAEAVRAFIAGMQSAGTLTAEQQAQAQALLDSLGGATAAETQQAADEAALQAEVPAPPAPPAV